MPNTLCTSLTNFLSPIFFTPLKIVNADRWSTVQSSKICTITCGKINRLSNFSHPRRGGEGQPRIGTTLKREKSGPSRGRAHKPNRGGMRPNPGAYAPGSYNLKPEQSSVSELRSPPVWKTLIFAFGAYAIQGLKKGSKIQHSEEFPNHA